MQYVTIDMHQVENLVHRLAAEPAWSLEPSEQGQLAAVLTTMQRLLADPGAVTDAIGAGPSGEFSITVAVEDGDVVGEAFSASFVPTLTSTASDRAQPADKIGGPQRPDGGDPGIKIGGPHRADVVDPAIKIGGPGRPDAVDPAIKIGGPGRPDAVDPAIKIGSPQPPPNIVDPAFKIGDPRQRPADAPGAPDPA